MPRVTRNSTATNNDFANALREVLGLAPLYQDGRTGSATYKQTMGQRFSQPHTWTWDRPGYSNGRATRPRNV